MKSFLKNTERIKSIVLVVLIVSSLVLSCQIWFNEKLWPDGYNFLETLKKTSFGGWAENFGKRNKKEETVQEDVLIPYNFFVYMVKDSDHAGYMLSAKDESFSYAKNYLHELMGKILSGTGSFELVSITEKEWQNALCEDGIYIDYGAAYNTKTFLQLFSAETQDDTLEKNIKKMGRFAITYDEGKVKLYICDLSDNTFYKTDYKDKADEVYNIIEMCRERATVDNRFSFFIGADKESPIKGTAVFDSYVVLSESVVEKNSAIAKSRLQLGEKIFNLSDGILQQFAVNPKTARRYTDAEENVVFVQNQSSVKFAQKGYVSFHAANISGGLDMVDGAESDTSLAVSLYPLVFMAERLNFLVTGNTDISLYVSSVKEENGKYFVTLDYTFNGSTLIIKDGNEKVYAVTAELEGGYLKNYKQYMTDLEMTQKKVLLPSSYGGADKIFESMTNEQREEKIRDIFVGYVEEDGGEINPNWVIRSGEEYSINY